MNRQKIILSALISLSCASPAWCRPEVFSDLSLDQAKEQAKKEGRLLVIDFMATWCPPCRKMESDTWENDVVKDYIKQNAIALQFDVDKDEKIASAFNVEAMPTLVLFTPEGGSKEFAREVGYMNSSTLLRWLKGAKSGKPAKDLKDELDNVVSDEAIWPRIAKARELASAGKNAEALDEYVWLWNNLGDDDVNRKEMRESLIPFEVKKLVAIYPPAKQKFNQLRDKAEKSANRHEWLVLNGILDDNARTVAWFDKAKIDPEEKDCIDKNATILEVVLFNSCRWSDAAKYLYPDPIAKINEYFKHTQEMKKPSEDTEVAKDFDPFPHMVLLLYGTYIGAGREADAKKIADECIRLDDTPTMRQALENMAIGTRKARSLHAQSSK